MQTEGKLFRTKYKTFGTPLNKFIGIKMICQRKIFHCLGKQFV